MLADQATWVVVPALSKTGAISGAGCLGHPANCWAKKSLAFLLVALLIALIEEMARSVGLRLGMTVVAASKTGVAVAEVVCNGTGAVDCARIIGVG